MSLAQAVTGQRHLDTIDIWLVTDKTVQVNRESTIPLKSILFGPSLVLPQENPHIACRLVDVEVAVKPNEASIDELTMQLLQECRALHPDPEPVVADRGPTAGCSDMSPLFLLRLPKIQPVACYQAVWGEFAELSPIIWVD